MPLPNWKTREYKPPPPPPKKKEAPLPPRPAGEMPVATQWELAFENKGDSSDRIILGPIECWTPGTRDYFRTDLQRLCDGGVVIRINPIPPSTSDGGTSA
jgi:hypothetical protein